MTLESLPENFNRSMPDVPFEIFSLATDHPDLTYSLRCDELWLEVAEEVLCIDYMNRSHHNVGTYDQGCRGPLCRKALREHPRRKSNPSITLALREDRIYDPVLEYFHTVLKFRVRNYQHAILKELA